MEVSTIRFYRGFAYETKPLEDPEGVRILPESIFEETDTGSRFRWAGNAWLAYRTAADVTVERLDELLTVQRETLSALLVALANVAAQEPFTPDDVMEQIR